MENPTGVPYAALQRLKMSTTSLPDLPSLGERVKWARHKAGLSQEELARRLNVDQTSVSKLEIGEIREPRTLEKLAAELCVPPEWLRFGVTNIENLTEQDVRAAVKLSQLDQADRAQVMSLIEHLSK